MIQFGRRKARRRKADISLNSSDGANSEHPLAVASKISNRIHVAYSQWSSLLEQTIERWADEPEWCDHCAITLIGGPASRAMLDAQTRLTYGLECMVNRPPREWADLLPRFSRWNESGGMRHNPGTLYAFWCQDLHIVHDLRALEAEIDADEDYMGSEAASGEQLSLGDGIPDEFCNQDCLCGFVEVWESTHHDLVTVMLQASDTLRHQAELEPEDSDEQWLCYQAVSHIVAAARRLTHGMLSYIWPHCTEDRRRKPRIPLYEAFAGAPGVPQSSDDEPIGCI